MGEAARRRQRARQLTSAAEETLIHRLVEVAPMHIDALACRTTIECIEAACIGLQVLRHFGVSAVERPVAMDALNPQMAEALRAGRDPATLTHADGAWVNSMGHDEGLRTDIQWDGHLVISTASGWLVDLWPTSRPEKGLQLDALCLPTRTLPATYSMPDGTLIAYYDKPANRFYQLAETWPRGYPEWRSTLSDIISELSVPIPTPPVRGDALFTRCSDELGVRDYVEAVFSVSPPEHLGDLARALVLFDESLDAGTAPQRIYEEVAALEGEREVRAALPASSA